MIAIFGRFPKSASGLFQFGSQDTHETAEVAGDHTSWDAHTHGLCFEKMEVRKWGPPAETASRQQISLATGPSRA
jgi:hypothetical protein